MKTILLGAFIIIGSGVLIAAVCLYFAKLVINSQRSEYEKLIKDRDDEIKDAHKDRARLTQLNSDLQVRLSELEAKLSPVRVNQPQKEFFTVPKRVTR